MLKRTVTVIASDRKVVQGFDKTRKAENVVRSFMRTPRDASKIRRARHARASDSGFQ